MNTPRWEHFEHGADIGVRGIGDDPAEAFAGAALAMTALVTAPDTVRAATAVDIHCREPDIELLLVDWLNRIVYETAIRRMLFSRFDIRLSAGGSLDARIWGEPLDRARHTPAVEIKGATFTELAVKQRADGRWLAQCVVDV